MATESDLRDLLRDPDPEGRSTIDLDAVLTRARRRRRPKVIAAQAIGSVAAVGALFTGIVALVPPPQPAVMVAEDAGVGDEFASEPAPADSTLRVAAERCGEPFTTASIPSPASLSLTPFSTDATDTLSVPVTLRNGGGETLSGSITWPRVVVMRDGVVVGRVAAVEAIAHPIALEPGESTTFDVAVEPYACDDPADVTEPLVLLEPGDYEMRPVLEFLPESDAEGPAGAIVGESQPLVIR